MKKTYAVFGLGRYGRAVAMELLASGAEVLAIDHDMENVNEASQFLPACKCADVTDPEAIRQLGIRNVDTVIIAMASSLEASVMATILCKEAGVETVIVKCAEELHRRIYEKVGADKVVFPEMESGTRLAKNLLSSGFVDVLELARDVALVELPVKAEWSGKNLIELGLRKKYGINVVAICEGDTVNTDIDPQWPLEKAMQLIVIGNTDKLSKLQ